MQFASVKEITVPLRAVGTVENCAGVLKLKADLSAELLCECARCLKEFKKAFHQKTEAVLADSVQNQDNTDIFLMDGDYIDLDEVVLTAFVLNIDQRFLCREDCRGLCAGAGKDLNFGPCDCRPEPDPRLAVFNSGSWRTNNRRCHQWRFRKEKYPRLEETRDAVRTGSWRLAVLSRVRSAARCIFSTESARPAVRITGAMSYLCPKISNLKSHLNDRGGFFSLYCYV
jgi:uncharacterized protein